MNNEGCFDFCIPTYNRVKLLEKMLSTIDTNVSVYISDNGGFVSKSGMNLTKNCKVISVDPVLDVYHNWSLAASFAKSNFFVMPSDDDLYEKGINDLLKSELNNNLDVGMVVFGHDFIDENNNVIGQWCPQSRILLSGKAAFDKFCFGVDARMPSIFINTALYNGIGGISLDFRITAADSELIQRLAMHAPVLFVPKVISSYRIWGGGITHNKLATKEWRDEIELWMLKLDNNLKEMAWGQNALWRKHIQDDIRLQNANAGLEKINGLRNGVKFLFLKKYPFFARPRTHIHCLIRLLKCMLGRH